MPSDPGAYLPPELDPRGRAHGNGSRRHRAPRRQVPRGAAFGVKAVVALLSVSVLVLSGYYWAVYRTFDTGLNRLNVSPVGAKKSTAPDIDGKDQNILIAGNDDRSSATDAELAALGTTRDGGSLNTDTMMVVHIPADGAKASVISFPRDSYVAIPGFGMDKLNAAYPDGYNATTGTTDQRRAGGARLLIQTITNLSGLHVDHFVQIDLLGFYRISNAIGGVPVVLCEAQHESNSGIDLSAGRHLIKGKQALAFVRQRDGLPNGDLDRIKRQQYFLSSAFRELTSGTTLLFRLQSVLSAVKASLQVDQTLNILDLARQLQNLTSNNISYQTIPTDGTKNIYPNGNTVNIVVVVPSAVQAFVSRLVVPTAAKTSSTPATPVTVDVLNAGGANGVARTSADVLKKYGFVIGQVGNATTQSANTVVEYPAGQSAAAARVAAYVKGASTQEASVSRVTLLIGGDGLSAQAPTAATSTPTSSAAPDTAACIN